MKAVFGTIIGLIFDDWILAIGTLLSIVITAFAIQANFNPEYSGWLLLALISLSLLLSLINQFNKKK